MRLVPDTETDTSKQRNSKKFPISLEMCNTQILKTNQIMIKTLTKKIKTLHFLRKWKLCRK